MNRGALIVFEGIDGSGKGTQIRMLKKRLEKEGYPVFRSAEPNDSPFGALIHQIMIGRVRTTNDAIAALFVADRLDHIQNETNGLLKFLRAGVNVLEDRYYFSSYAYQSVDLPMEWIIEANAPCAKLLKADLTVFIDVDPKVTMERIDRNRMTKELFERTDRQTETRARYLDAFGRMKDTERVLIVNGDREPDIIAEEIWEKTRDLFVPAQQPVR